MMKFMTIYHIIQHRNEKKLMQLHQLLYYIKIAAFNVSISAKQISVL